MAEIILSPLADLIIQTLASAAVEKIGALYSVTDELKDLEATLKAIKAVLLDAERQQVHNEQVRLWLHRLADVVIDADDLVDGVTADGLLKKKKLRIFFSCSNQLVFRNKLSGEIRSIRKRLDKISADRRDFKLEVSTEAVLRRSWRESHSFVLEESVVGRDGDKTRVLELLSEKKEERSVRVVTIFGMGGLGKTTLAQLVFNDESFQKRFDKKIWVCVSEDFEVKVIVGLIVKSFPDTSVADGDTMEKLQKTLREKLKGRRYLLVLDDVWNDNQLLWQDLMDILSTCGEFGSRIIVTARSECVAKITSNDVSLECRLRVLSEDESWSLFKKIAFKQSEPMESIDGVEVGKEIVKKCGGIPLAIKMIASMLSGRDPKTEWHSFLKKELSSLPQQENGILPTLKLSYNSLPLHLKNCFAYCRLFPKDYELHVQTLINLWMAHGFICASSRDNSPSMEDIGYDHFSELLARSFFQEAKIDESVNMVVTCKMHDLVHDLAVQVAGKEYVSNPSNEKDINAKALHVSTDLGKLPRSLLRARRLRSLLFPYKNLYKSTSELTSEEVVSKFKFLRALNFRSLDFEAELDSIGKLKHLRYLDLSETGIQRFPACITKLVNLQTLKLNDCQYLLELPRDLHELINLRHLEFSNTDSSHRLLSLPRGVSRLTNLRTLSYFSLSEDCDEGLQSGCLDDLKGLKNLSGNIDIIGLKAGVETTSANMKEKEHLRSISLEWSMYESTSIDEEWYETLEGLTPHPNLRKLIVDGYNGVRFSNWLSSLTNLIELRLEKCLKLRQLSSLEQLCSLKNIFLSHCSELEYIITDVVGDRYFSVLPSLQRLELKRLWNFRGWKNSNTTDNDCQYFPRLTNLRILDCPKLTSFPLYPYVNELNLTDGNKKLFEQTMLMSTPRPQISAAATTTSEALFLKSLPSTFHPLSAVKDLILYCPNNTVAVQCFPDWMQCLSSVEQLHLCMNRPPTPIALDFSGRTMTWEILGDDEREMAIKRNYVTWKIFSSIRMLSLVDVPALKYLSGPIQFITSLEKLCITACEELELPIDGTYSIKFDALTTLRSLGVNDCHRLTSIPDWICKLSSLQELNIRSCSKIESFPRSMSNLTCLHTLEISDCPISFEGSNDSSKWGTLRNLKLEYLPKIVTLPAALQCSTTLQRLKLDRCSNLTTPPDWVCEVPSLRELVINNCPKIESLPRSIRSFTSLQKLHSFNCPILSERYCKETGKDWPEIKHIPDVSIHI